MKREFTTRIRYNIFPYLLTSARIFFLIRNLLNKTIESILRLQSIYIRYIMSSYNVNIPLTIESNINENECSGNRIKISQLKRRGCEGASRYNYYFQF